jgi:hypothetical protein
VGGWPASTGILAEAVKLAYTQCNELLGPKKAYVTHVFIRMPVIKLRHSGNRILLSVLIVAFLGQSLSAVASTCVTMGSGNVEANSEAMDHHDHSAHGSDQSDDQPETLCCDGAGSCSMLNCISVFAMPATALGLFFSPEVLANATFTPTVPHFIPATLFKPPIIA